METVAVVSAIIAGCSAAFTAVGLFFARSSAKAATTSADNSGRSADNSGRSADAAEASAEESTRSADAAERSASAAERGVALTEADQAAAAHRRAAHELGGARLVTVELSYMGALAVHITNGSSSAISRLVLEDVVAQDAPTLQWQPSYAVMGNRTQWAVVRAGEEVRSNVELVQPETGRPEQGFPSDRQLVVTYSWTDAAGQRWRYGSEDDPERVGES